MNQTVLIMTYGWSFYLGLKVKWGGTLCFLRMKRALSLIGSMWAVLSLKNPCNLVVILLVLATICSTIIQNSLMRSLAKQKKEHKSLYRQDRQFNDWSTLAACFKRQMPYKHSSPMYSACEDALAEFIYEDYESISVVESPSFLKVHKDARSTVLASIMHTFHTCHHP